MNFRNAITTNTLSATNNRINVFQNTSKIIQQNGMMINFICNEIHRNKIRKGESNGQLLMVNEMKQLAFINQMSSFSH